MNITIKEPSLYLVSGEDCSLGRSTLEVAEAAIAGGVDILQMREKNKNKQELLEIGQALAGLCQQSDVFFIVNDDPYLASEIDADGVHLGQEDMEQYPITLCRELLGKDKYIGVSTHSIDDIQAANELDINYIGYGPVYKTKTKDYYIGIDGVAEALKTSKHPIFFIGGITHDNIGKLWQKGAKNFAFIRAITEAKDIGAAVQELKGQLQ